MKKITLAIISVALALCLTFTATGCSSKPFLSFDSSFNGVGDNGSNHSGLTETLTYSVDLEENYNELILKMEALKDEVVDYEFSNGKYVQTLTVQSYFPADTLGVTTDIQIDGEVYHLNTLLTIDVKYTINGEQEPYVHTDVVETDCYFLSAGQSFAPLYSKMKIDNTYLSLSDSFEQAALLIGVYEHVIVYNQKTYTLKSTSLANSVKEPDKVVTPEVKEKTYDYESKKVIDNAQLLFALRNVTIDEKTPLELPVVSPSYGVDKTLRITNKESSTISREITYNDTTANIEVPVNNFNFIISATENTGAFHYMKYQKSEAGHLPNRALLVEYASPLISFGAFGCLGALVYRLDSVQVSKA